MNEEEMANFIDALREKFSSNEVPTPLRIQYTWRGHRATGELYAGGTIFGFPGVVQIRDDDVHDVRLEEE